MINANEKILVRIFMRVRVAFVCFLVFSLLALPDLVLSIPPSKDSKSPKHLTGYVKTDDGVRLYYEVIGQGPETIIIPGRLFLIHALQKLAANRRLIFYDTRGRGNSDAIHDAARETIADDVRDLETIRNYFGANKTTLIGYSYMGLLVVLYAEAHSSHVVRVAQLGPEQMKWDTTFPPGLSQDYTSALDSEAAKELNEAGKKGFARSHPREFCKMDWNVNRLRLVGDATHVTKIGMPPDGLCDFPNEWPVNMNSHWEALFASIRKVNFTKDDLARITMPVLTIHGTKDYNAPYGGGREWAMLLPNARLLTVVGGGHQSFDEYPEIVIPAIDLFLKGSWPPATERVITLSPYQQ